VVLAGSTENKHEAPFTRQKRITAGDARISARRTQERFARPIRKVKSRRRPSPLRSRKLRLNTTTTVHRRNLTPHRKQGKPAGDTAQQERRARSRIGAFAQTQSTRAWLAERP